MNKLRQDGWTQDDDILLAEIVLSHIRNGKTQLDAFKIAAGKLSRTPAACGFRWNATIRHQYEDAIYLAKNAQKQQPMQNNLPINQEQQFKQGQSLDSAITLLKNLKNHVIQQEQTINNESQLVHLQKENRQLKIEIKRYEEAWKEMGNLWEWIKSEK